MNNGSESSKRLALVGAFIVAALIINFSFFRQATNHREIEANDKQAKESALAKEKQDKDAAILADQKAKEAAEKLKRDKDEADRIATEKKAAAEKAKAEAEQSAEAERQRIIKESADQHARYLARYLSPDFERKAGVTTVAVAVASEAGVANLEVAEALARRFQTNNVQLLSAFFTPAFVADSFVSQIFQGRTEIFKKLELTNSLDAILVGKQTVEYAANPALENSISANLQLELMALPIRANEAGNSWKFVGKGVGFNKHEARMMAQERIIKQIADDATMKLERSLPRKQ